VMNACLVTTSPASSIVIAMLEPFAHEYFDLAEGVTDRLSI
jgi:hypothetical protein